MSPVGTRILAFHRRRHCGAPAFSLSTPRTLTPWKPRRIPWNSFCWNLLYQFESFCRHENKEDIIIRVICRADLQLPGASSKLSFFLLFPKPILFNWSSIRRFAFWKVRPTLRKRKFVFKTKKCRFPTSTFFKRDSEILALLSPKTHPRPDLDALRWWP